MSRQVSQYERVLFDIITEHTHRFYYEGIFKTIDEEEFKVKIEKPEEEMVGRAYVTFTSGDRIEYEIRYNRVMNITEGYTLFIPGTKAG
ncbi:MAG: hypothetical protein N2484_17560 [Clostridia bacterium]|nr:hypothetical protein [Clostridia bacterium]